MKQFDKHMRFAPALGGLAAVAAMAVLGAPARGGNIFVAGNAQDNIITALNNLGESFTILATNMPSQAQIDGLGSSDILVWGQDGGTTDPPDLNRFLDSGGCVILTGGSNWDLWRAWALGYFDTTDTGSHWHTDGDWHKLANHPATSFMPANYTFAENGHTFHMLAFLASTPNSVMLGENDEPFNIAAFRTYANGGSFNYMALDLGIRTQDQPFIDNWLRGGLLCGAGGFDLTIDMPQGCPGPITVSWSGSPGNGLQALVVGNSLGSTTIPQNQPCSGTILGLQGGVAMVDPPGFFSNQGGSGSISGNVNNRVVCGKYLQLVRGGTCETSNVAQIN